MNTKRKIVAVVLVAAMAVGSAAAGYGDEIKLVPALITLVDGSSEVTIDSFTSQGALDWTVMNVSHLAQQWFWIRTDTEGLFDDREYSIDEIDATPAIWQPTANIAELSYNDGRIEVQIMYILASGPGLYSADLTEVITVTNLTDEEILVDFFQYSDFDLNGDGAEDDVVSITGGNTALQKDFESNTTLSETVVSRSPELSEVGIYHDTLDKLTDGGISDLDGSTHLDGPANLTWAFQWQGRLIYSGESLVIAKDKVLTTMPVVAEPGGGALLAAAVGALAGRRKRRT
ncbi:MAG: hypothetical protein ABIF82_12760 [Planctomycetota bacterium]